MSSPLCQYFGKCGGCTSQHIEYETQIINKKNQLARSIDFSDITVVDDQPYYYRNRMDLIFHPHGLGFREKGKWYSIVDIQQCVISNSKLNQLLNEIRDFFKGVDSFDLHKHTGTYRYAVIRTPEYDSSISFVLNEKSTKIAEAHEKIKAFAAKIIANNIIITYANPESDVSISSDFFVVKGKDMLEETYLGKKFLYSVQGFFQNNFRMAEKMHQHVHAILKSYKPAHKHLLDLYAGVGTFGIINAGLFKTVTMIESVKECIDAANQNIVNNEVKNVQAFVLDAQHIKRLNLQQPLFVITDPPRSGMSEKTIELLKNLEPEVIIYVSCNIEQLGKDVKKFKKYQLKSAALFDLFPQTPHSEAIVELVRKTD
ncbi:23S rRNA (uracil(1939)-C(5))-methyltransferase RlmD [Candidatus Woesearchaeota archaeon]|nr:23S rRNA (uracil(1939)-C(5))-methyltransferase RlmD [Candidatus Woesearchaeota archaeon]